jgi:hypothetical protein
MAKLLSNGFFYSSRCERSELTRADFFVDNSKRHSLSHRCKRCESERTKKPKHGSLSAVREASTVIKAPNKAALLPQEQR